MSSALQSTLMRFHVVAEGGIDAALISPALCFEEVHHQALRHLGQMRVNDAFVANLQKMLSANDKKVLIRDLRYAPAWMAAILRRVAGPEER